MKKINVLLSIILMLFIGLLTSCELFDYTLSSNTTKSTSTTSNTTIKGDVIELNKYGDYVEALDSSSKDELTAKYNDLKKSTKGNITYDVFQEDYDKGLLELFNLENKIELVINISDSTLRQLNDDFIKGNTESYRECSLEIYYLNLHFHYEGVGIRQKGNLSRGEILTNNKLNMRHYKLSFEETFDDEYTENKKVWDDKAAYEYRQDRKFFGMNKLDLRWNRCMDQSYIKEYASYEIFRKCGVLAQKSNLMNLKMNIDGKSVNLGVYLGVESITKSFIKRNIVKDERGGDLYKLSWGSGVGAKFDSTSSNLFGVSYLTKNSNGSFTEYKYTYDLKTNKDTSDFSSIKNFISDLNNEHGDTIYDFMMERSVYEEWINYLAISYLLGDPDDLRGNYNNTYVYFTQSGKIIFIPVDSDRTLGNGDENNNSNATGSYQALVKPFDRKTGYSENNDKLINVNILSSNSKTVTYDYIVRIKEIIDSHVLDIEYFENCFNIAKNHYEKVVKPSSDVSNEFNLPSFSLDASTNIYSSKNLSIETYINTKIGIFIDYYEDYYA